MTAGLAPGAGAATAGTWAWVLVLASLSAATSWIGVTIALRIGGRPDAVAAGIGFSTGIMLAVAGGELLPEAWRLAGAREAVVGAALGAGLIAALHLVLPHTHLLDEAGGDGVVRLSSAYLVAVGLILHDFPEGFALAGAYLADPGLGVVVAVAIAVHNVPEEFAMAVPAAALRRRRFLVGAAVVSALAEPVGAVIGLGASGLHPSLNAGFVAFGAGAMIYVALHELVPMARRVGRVDRFAAGAVAAVATAVVLHLLVRP